MRQTEGKAHGSEHNKGHSQGEPNFNWGVRAKRLDHCEIVRAHKSCQASVSNYGPVRFERYLEMLLTSDTQSFHTNDARRPPIVRSLPSHCAAACPPSLPNAKGLDRGFHTDSQLLLYLQCSTSSSLSVGQHSVQLWKHLALGDETGKSFGEKNVGSSGASLQLKTW